MPLLHQRILSETQILGIWQLTESEEELHAQHYWLPEFAVVPSIITHPERRAQWLATRVLLAELHQREEIKYDENGKPFLSVTNKHLSISHSKNLIALIIDHNPVGIDIEHISPKIERIARKFIQPTEIADAMREDSIRKMYVYWCVKEAIYKVNGDKGVSLLQNIAVEPFSMHTDLEIIAHVRFNTYQLTRKLRFEQFGEFMLAYTCSE
ncbi:MAG: 4'-phosphopantetheinyl transferase family protein [Bacteroidia bacterium]